MMQKQHYNLLSDDRKQAVTAGVKSAVAYATPVFQGLVCAGFLAASGLIIAEILDKGVNADYNYLGGDDYIVASLAAIAGIALLANVIIEAKHHCKINLSALDRRVHRYRFNAALAAISTLGVYGVAVGLSTLFMPETGPLGTPTDHMEKMSHMGFTDAYDNVDVAVYFAVFGAMAAIGAYALGSYVRSRYTTVIEAKNQAERRESFDGGTSRLLNSSTSSSSSSSSPRSL